MSTINSNSPTEHNANNNMDNWVVEEDGIFHYSIIKTDCAISDISIPRDIFIEAFNKYIKYQENDWRVKLP